MTPYEKLNFPDFKHSLQLWPDVCRKMRPDDDWEWWWVCFNDDSQPELVLIECDIFEWAEWYYKKYSLFFAIPCPSLGEMLEELAIKGYTIYPMSKKLWCCSKCRWFFKELGILPYNTESDTAPNAAAKGLKEVEG